MGGGSEWFVSGVRREYLQLPVGALVMALKSER